MTDLKELREPRKPIPIIGEEPDFVLQTEQLLMSEKTPEQEKELLFELGLVMAGAVSAGAYTAGVVDFLLEALEAWELAKEKEKDLPVEKRTIPFHKVRIKVLSGASAGGMTAAMMAAMFRKKAMGGAKSPSLLKEMWVNEIDISHLLENSDLNKKDHDIRSILDSTVITEIANKAINFPSAPSEQACEWKPINYVDEKLKLYLTLSNLRGVPYEFKISGETGFKYGMLKFSDYEEATISKDTTPEEWERIKDAAMATGAFPIGLSARIIHRNPKEYFDRSKTDKMDFISMKFDRHGSYTFTAVDGGVLNNEPLELCRKALFACTGQSELEATVRKDSTGKYSEDEKWQKYVKTLDRSLILIDPFPNVVEIQNENDNESSLGLFKVIPRLIMALRRQALFKADELFVAAHKKIYSSFMIAPIRFNNKGLRAENPIASGFLGGFGGFFLKEFREHDYQLGRRNCQRFLQKYFVVPAEEFQTNRIFNGRNGELLAKYKAVEKYTIECEEKERVFYPIIPIVDGMGKEEPRPQWPPYNEAKVTSILRKVEKRLKLVLDTLLSKFRYGWWIKNSWMFALFMGIGLLGVNVWQENSYDIIVSVFGMGLSWLTFLEFFIVTGFVISSAIMMGYSFFRGNLIRGIKSILKQQLKKNAIED